MEMIKQDNEFTILKGIRGLNFKHAKPLQFIDKCDISDYYKNLDEWGEIFLKIENLYLTNNGIPSKGNELKGLIKNSLTIINEFNSKIVYSIELGVVKTKNNKERIGPRNQSCLNRLLLLSRYIKFYSNLIASKVKHFLYNEDVYDNINYPYLSVSKDMLFAGFALVDSLKEFHCKEEEFDKINSFASRLYYLQNKIYSFVFDKIDGNGAFLSFKNDVRVFEDVETIIKKALDLLSDNEPESKLKIFCSIIFYLISEYYNGEIRINRDKQGRSVIHEDSLHFFNEIYKPRCYEKLYQNAADRQFYAEPFTYRLCDILWKINGMLKV